MTIEVRLRPEAEQDLAEAAAWYEDQRPGLGRQLLEEAEAMLSAIGERPLAYPSVHRNARRAVLRRFPFAVFYRVELDQAVVLGILHGSRDPNSWKTRT